MVLHIFLCSIYVFYFRKHLQHRVRGTELPLLISTAESVQEKNDQQKSQAQKKTS